MQQLISACNRTCTIQSQRTGSEHWSLTARQSACDVDCRRRNYCERASCSSWQLVAQQRAATMMELRPTAPRRLAWRCCVFLPTFRPYLGRRASTTQILARVGRRRVSRRHVRHPATSRWRHCQRVYASEVCELVGTPNTVVKKIAHSLYCRFVKK